MRAVFSNNIRMWKAIVIALLATSHVAFGQEKYQAKRFAYSQAMVNCMGKMAYWGWYLKSIRFMKECYSELTEDWSAFQVEDLLGNPSQSANKHSYILDAGMMRGIWMDVLSKVNVYGCILEKMNIVDENLQLQYDFMKEEFKNITSDPAVNQDLVNMIDYCQKIATDLPETETSPLPMEVQRMMAFMQCHKQKRLELCMKSEYKKTLSYYDVSVLPFKDEDDDIVAAKLAQMFLIMDSKDEIEVY